MKLLSDDAEVKALAEEARLAERFSTEGLAFRGFLYPKGELLYSPLNSTEHLLFLVRGSVQMYELSPDGAKRPVASLSEGAVLGDIEFITRRPSVFFVEAAEDCVCLALSMEASRTALEGDPRFLWALLEEMADKFEQSADAGLSVAPLEEKLLQYLRQNAPDGEVRDLEPLLYQLHCGRRQLQRVLKKLCDSGALLRLGKGYY
ncbi:MAG: cyclic nucleotide-binding domain-containing protein, partial [Oscillospiraceae bacterium]|nr:cyclic nucleotide-binding domain-containing protein [Oscillospiraceae bacterium]